MPRVVQQVNKSVNLMFIQHLYEGLCTMIQSKERLDF